MERLRAVVHGDVQGVGYRYFMVDEARALGLHGWVRNRSDGSVELVAEGDRSTLERLLEAARRGPRHAVVRGIDTDWDAARGGLEPFNLIY